MAERGQLATDAGNEGGSAAGQPKTLAREGTAAFEQVVKQLVYPMLIATTSAGGELSGCLVGFATQVSLDPARYLVCISNKNHTHRVAVQASHLAVNFVAIDQVAVARLFGERSGDRLDKFAHCDWTMTADNVPVLSSAEGWFAGPIVELVPFGDHTGFVIEPDCGGAAERMADLLSSFSVRDFEAGHGA